MQTEYRFGTNTARHRFCATCGVQAFYIPRSNPDGVADLYRAGIPTGRYAMPDEVANVVMYLCSDLSGDVTGTHLVIDGGRLAGGAGQPLRKG